MSKWKETLKTNFTRIDPLLDFLQIGPELASEIDLTPEFRLNLPRRLAEKCAKGTLDDPILAQFLPLKLELQPTSGCSNDPVEESKFIKAPRLLQKYARRSLIVATGTCPMHCRYCFRRAFPYDKTPSDYDQELFQLAQDPTQDEVILSGGDPLSLHDEALEKLLQKIEAIPHINRIRFHTRYPIGIPERIDDSFLNLLARRKTQIWFVVHVNHPKELDQEVLASLKEIQKLGIPVLSQTVLLRGVNDSLEVLEPLFRTLVNGGITPYYLHQLDPVSGGGHFEVPKERGLKLIEELAATLPGYALPRYVQEVPGALSKTILCKA